VAPLAVKVAEAFEQIVAEFAVTIGAGLTVMLVVAVPTHPPLVPVTV
jgi:hypothetical protein